MPITDKFFSINIRKYLALGDDHEAGEPALVKLLSGFSCPRNPDVERFLKKSAIEGEMLGYFALALKPLTIRGETVSNTTKRKLLRVSELDEKSNTYTMSAYLIAQLGKNYADGRDKEITGKELIELAWIIIEKTQYMLGGMVTFLEAENEEKLLSYLQSSGFKTLNTN